MKLILKLLLFFLFLFSACSSEEYKLTKNDTLRINILYEHTIIMLELSSQEQLKELGLNGENLKRDSLLSSQDKIRLLEEAYYLDLGNKRIDKKIVLLEDKMLDMMKNWS